MLVNCSGQEVSVFSFINVAQSSDNPSFFYFFYGLEHFAVQLLNLLTVYFIFLLVRIKVWHSNLSVLLVFFVFSIFWCTTGRVSILILEVVGLDEGNCSDVYRIATFLQVLYAVTCSHVLPAILLERLMAFHFLEDYESRSRWYIPATLIFVSFGIASSSTYLMTRASTANLLWYAILLNAISFALFVALWMKNSNKLRVVDFDGKYTLSKRFQLVENLKVFKLLRNEIIVMVILVTVLGFFKIAVPAFYYKGVRYDSYLVSLMIWAQTVILIVAIGSIELWKNFTLSLFPWRRNKVHSLVKVVPLSEEAALYFDQLHKSWMIPDTKDKLK